MSRPVEVYLSTKQSPLVINSNILVIVEVEGRVAAMEENVCMTVESFFTALLIIGHWS
jgi:hypothetical protein